MSPAAGPAGITAWTAVVSADRGYYDHVREENGSDAEGIEFPAYCAERRFALAGPVGKDFYSGYSEKIVATKYPTMAEKYFRERGVHVKIIKIDGSVELAPLLGLASAIVDIVETGATLHENGLVVYEEICPVSARLIVNAAALKMKKMEIDDLVEKIKSGLMA